MLPCDQLLNLVIYYALAVTVVICSLHCMDNSCVLHNKPSALHNIYSVLHNKSSVLHNIYLCCTTSHLHCITPFICCITNHLHCITTILCCTTYPLCCITTSCVALCRLKLSVIIIQSLYGWEVTGLQLLLSQYTDRPLGTSQLLLF